MDPFNLYFLANAALFLGVFLVSYLSESEETETSSAADEADFIGTLGDDNVSDPLQGFAGMLELLDGDDTAEGSAMDDTILGGAGDDELIARLGNDSLLGGSGDDYLEGNFGFDTLNGNEGDDTLLGAADDDRLTGGDGDDELSGGKDSDVLRGGAGDDLLEGGEGADDLKGGSGDDTLNGTYGDGTLSNTVDEDLADTLDGGPGDDRLILGSDDEGKGGDGADVFALDEAIEDNGAALVSDFDPSVDRIELEVTGPADPSLLTIEDYDDGSGATIFYNGNPMGEIEGAAGLDPASIVLVEV